MKRDRFPEWDEEILFQYLIMEKSMTEISNSIGWSLSFVRHRLNKYGVEINSKRRYKKQKSIDVSEVEYLWNETNMTVVEISEMLNFSRSYIYDILRELGYKNRPRRASVRVGELEIKQVAFMYKELEWDAKQIADYFGWKDKDSVYLRLKHAGIPRRSKSEVNKRNWERRKAREKHCSSSSARRVQPA